MIKVLIVEDSPVMQELLRFTLNADPDFSIIDIAADGEEAIKSAVKHRPDVIAMDYFMPKLNGEEATRRIMEICPTPIVIVTGNFAAKYVTLSFSLIEAGALAIVKKPPCLAHPDYKKDALELIQTLKLMSEVKVVRRFGRIKREDSRVNPVPAISINKTSKIQVVVIGASTGGPNVLQKIISGLPKDYPYPILIVQHISKGFVLGFAEWLSKATNFPFHIACQGEYPLPGNGYIAPDSFHMGIERGPRIVLSDHEPENGLKPSIAFLFRTAAKIFGSEAVGILLTGMGKDGAKELKLMKDHGAVTIVQDQKSSVVYGMPGEAIILNAAMHILSPEEIIAALTVLVNRN